MVSYEYDKSIKAQGGTVLILIVMDNGLLLASAACWG